MRCESIGAAMDGRFKGRVNRSVARSLAETDAGIAQPNAAYGFAVSFHSRRRSFRLPCVCLFVGLWVQIVENVETPQYSHRFSSS
jgi:hypothetical protein